MSIIKNIFYLFKVDLEDIVSTLEYNTKVLNHRIKSLQEEVKKDEIKINKLKEDVLKGIEES